MPRSRFAELAQQLLDDGVSPKFVYRLERELEAHFDDLRSVALSRQESPEDAEKEALSRLGDAESITMLFRERPELRLWIYKRPWAWAVNLLVDVLLSIQRPGLFVSANRATLTRFGSAAVLSVGMTVLVFFFMVSLIVTADDLALISVASQRIDYFNVNRVSIEQEAVVTSETRADEIELEALRYRQFARPNDAGQFVTVEGWLERAAAPGLVRGPRLNFSASIDPSLDLDPSDGDYQAVLKVAPTYPHSALKRGLEGYVIVEFTITRVGTVRDIEVVESSNRIFESSSTDAVSKYRYRPRIVSGKPRAVPNVRNKISYEIEA